MQQRSLFWDGRSGLAYCDGMSLPLPRRPRVHSLDVEQIDYLPGHFHTTRKVQEVGQQWRELTDEECAYIDSALQRMKRQGIQEIC